MDYETHAIGKAIRPLFAEPVTNMVHITLITISLTVGSGISDTSYSISFNCFPHKYWNMALEKRGMQLLPELLIWPQMAKMQNFCS